MKFKSEVLCMFAMPLLFLPVAWWAKSRTASDTAPNRVVIVNQAGQPISRLRVVITQDAKILPYHFVYIPNGREISIPYNIPASCQSLDIQVDTITQDGRRSGAGYSNRIPDALHRSHSEMFTLQAGHHFIFRPLFERRRRFHFF